MKHEESETGAKADAKSGDKAGVDAARKELKADRERLRADKAERRRDVETRRQNAAPKK